MQFCVIIALTLLSLAHAVPSDPDGNESSEPIEVTLADADRNHFCRFLTSLGEIRRGLYSVYLGHNVGYIGQANDRVVDEAARLKNNLSDETVAAEREFFEYIDTFEKAQKTGMRLVNQLLNKLEPEIKTKYQC